jgi:CrcB protein
MAGGAVGAVLRYIIGSAVSVRYVGRFPLGTFLINITGSFLIGLLMTFFTERSTLHPNWRLLLVTGVLGGYTTFSSFEYEALVATRTGSYLVGGFYVIASVSIGLFAAWFGSWIVIRR